MEEEHDLAQDKGETFDLSAFLESLKKPRAALRNIKANYIVELKERIETGGSVQDGLSKEECLYYIEAFVSIDMDESGAISEQELFEGKLIFFCLDNSNLLLSSFLNLILICSYGYAEYGC